MFREMELSSPKIKKILIFSQKKLFFYFRRDLSELVNIKKNSTLKKFPIFWEMELSDCKLKKLLHFLWKEISYISGGNMQSLKNKNFFETLVLLVSSKTEFETMS